MKYFIPPDFFTSLQKLFQKGGQFQKAARQVEAIHSRVERVSKGEDIDPFEGIPLTNKGENRIEHCVKYDLINHCRLVTIKDNGVVALLYTGSHDDEDKWLEKNKGLVLRLDGDLRIKGISKSRDLANSDTKITTKNDWSEGFLFEKIPSRYYDKMCEGITKRSVLMKFEKLTTANTEEELSSLSYELDDENKMLLFYDVFTLLKASKWDKAKARVDEEFKEFTKIADLPKEDLSKILESDDFIDFENFDEDIMRFLMTANYQQWMLFMHPEQKKMVNKDFSGPAKLSGVSGSGKTCVLIKRAIRLAGIYENEKILILTLNKSLAQLIQELTDVAAPDSLKSRIEVKSFWKLCQEQLNNFEPHNIRLYSDVTWKNGEHIDEIWEEFYNCNNNNNDAEIFWPVHKSLLSRGIYPFDYLKQEFDWVRSVLAKSERSEYINIERTGRTATFDKNFRAMVTSGLSSWEQKMKDIGVTDYLNLATAFYDHIDKIQPMYRCVLVDEEQDFGLIELKIIRKLVKEAENDIFLTGDFAQKVSTKFHSYKDASINLIGRSTSIKKNYRNSREILTAAYNVFVQNMSEEVLNDEEYELQDPEYANYSNVKPLLLRAKSWNEELGYSINYYKQQCEDDKKACIAICGLTFREVKHLGDKLKIPVLDGSISLSAGKLFLSDLEQTKGFEFDYMCILNCNEEVIPNKYLPEAEWYRELSKIYVAMTRAKRELFISYSNQPSRFIDKSKEFFIEYDWVEQENDNSLPDIGLLKLNSLKVGSELLKLKGKEFLYQKEAVGISLELQDKLQSLILGQNTYTDRKQTGWKTIEDALNEKNIPVIAQAFGSQKTWPEFNEFFNKLKK